MQSWLIRAKETHRIHAEHLAEDSDWLIADTAKLLKRSLGGICEDLLIVKYLKNYREAIEKLSYMKDALEFVREKQREEKLDSIE